MERFARQALAVLRPPRTLTFCFPLSTEPAFTTTVVGFFFLPAIAVPANAPTISAVTAKSTNASLVRAFMDVPSVGIPPWLTPGAIG